MKPIFSPSPSKEFNDDAKRKFLAAFDAYNPPAAARASWTAVLARSFAAALAIVVIGGFGATVYADAANVPATSPLYAFKRIGEKVQLAVAPSNQHAAIEAEFAARRVAEADFIAKNNPTSTMAAELSAQADADLNASIRDAGKDGLEDGALAEVCKRIFSVLSSSSTTMQGELQGNLNELDKFTTRCEIRSGVSGYRFGASGGEFSSSTIASSSPEGVGAPEHGRGDSGRSPFTPTSGAAASGTGTVLMSSTDALGGNVPELEARIREYLNAAASSSEIAPPATSSQLDMNGGENGNGGDGAAGGVQGNARNNSAIIEFHSGHAILPE